MPWRVVVVACRRLSVHNNSRDTQDQGYLYDLMGILRFYRNLSDKMLLLLNCMMNSKSHLRVSTKAALQVSRSRLHFHEHVLALHGVDIAAGE